MVRQSLEATWGSYYTVQKRVDSDLHWASLERARREKFASDLGAGVARPGRPIGWFLLHRPHLGLNLLSQPRARLQKEPDGVRSTRHWHLNNYSVLVWPALDYARCLKAAAMQIIHNTLLFGSGINYTF